LTAKNIKTQIKPFSLLIKPASADCNLNCTYCFYLGHSALYPETKVHRMSDKVLEKLISSYLATDQPQYSFGWQGGEPTLMGLDFFKRVVDLQQKYGHSGSSVANGLQTNTILINDELAQHLAEYKFLVGASLDGPAYIHDHYRAYKDGRGSHADVMRSIECLKRNHVEFNILTLINNTNVRKPKEIYQYLCDSGFLYHQYIECVEFDPKGTALPFSINGEEWGNFLCEIFDEWIKHDTRRVSIRLFDSILVYMVDGIRNVCNIGKDCCQYLAVEYNGDVYPCDFFITQDLKIGNITGGTWEDFLNSPVYRKFGRQKAQLHKQCLACEYMEYCLGDCLKNRFYGKHDPHQISRLCEGWKMFYNHTLPEFKKLAAQIRLEQQQTKAKTDTSVQQDIQSGKTGRNAPCPCGSGLKYKKCCG